MVYSGNTGARTDALPNWKPVREFAPILRVTPFFFRCRCSGVSSLHPSEDGEALQARFKLVTSGGSSDRYNEAPEALFPSRHAYHSRRCIPGRSLMNAVTVHVCIRR